MHVEVLGKYRLELSAMQWIHNGGWAAYVAIRTVEENHPAQPDLLPYQQVVDESIFESEAAAIAGARRVAMALLAPAVRKRQACIAYDVEANAPERLVQNNHD